MEQFFFIFVEVWCYTCAVPIRAQVTVGEHNQHTIPQVEVVHVTPIIHRVKATVF